MDKDNKILHFHMKSDPYIKLKIHCGIARSILYILTQASIENRNTYIYTIDFL